MLTPASIRIPHSLRLVIFFLRVTLGFNFFYIGLTTLFSKTLQTNLQGQSMNGLYRWLATPGAYPWLHPSFQWLFLLIGACLILGLATRPASILGLALVAFSFLPTVNFAAPNLSQFVNDKLVIFCCLLVILVANAGTYIGLDRFFHFSLRHKAAK
jgi:uncharacterized membrane protein YphA (DoxX/SURF4 family)